MFLTIRPSARPIATFAPLEMSCPPFSIPNRSSAGPLKSRNGSAPHVVPMLGALPFLLFNGPALERFGIENGGQLISKGANVAIGRALGLIVKNIAGYKFGRN